MSGFSVRTNKRAADVRGAGPQGGDRLPTVSTLAAVPSAYRDYSPPRELAQVAACLWEHAATSDHRQRVVPDGCVDLVLLCGRELMVAGADTGPRTVGLPAGSRSNGIRLRPGAAGAVLGLPACEVRDRQAEVQDVWGQDGTLLEDALLEAHAAERLRILAAAVARRRARRDALIAAAMHRLSVLGTRVADAAAELGVSERQLHRRTVAAVGYGPKTLSRVARLRRLVSLGNEPLADRALSAGYASQSHMTDEARRLTGTTPVRFLEDAVLTAG